MNNLAGSAQVTRTLLVDKMPARMPSIESRNLAAFARACDQILLQSRAMSVEQRIDAFEHVKREYLKHTSGPAARLEMRRRTAEHILSAVAERRQWPLFARYLRRLERLGFSTIDKLVWASAIASRVAHGDAAASAWVRRLAGRASRMLADPRLHPAYRQQELAILEQTLRRLDEPDRRP